MWLCSLKPSRNKPKIEKTWINGYIYSSMSKTIGSLKKKKEGRTRQNLLKQGRFVLENFKVKTLVISQYNTFYFPIGLQVHNHIFLYLCQLVP